MIGKEQLFYDNNRLCIEIARGEGVLKGFDAPQNKQSAFLYHKAQLIELPWQGVQMLGQRCCLVFYPHEMLTEIPTPSAGEGNGNPFQYSCLGNPIDRGVWQLWSIGLQRVEHD